MPLAVAILEAATDLLRGNEETKPYIPKVLKTETRKRSQQRSVSTLPIRYQASSSLRTRPFRLNLQR
jgi:hypothetical protein